MAEYDSYQFFAVFSKINGNMDNESERSELMDRFNTLLSDAAKETGMIEGAVIIQRDDGIGPAGSNRTFKFDIYVPEKSMVDPETFDGEAFKQSVELYLHDLQHYDWMQVLNKDSDIKFGKASEIRDQF